MTRILPPWWLHQYNRFARSHLFAGLELARLSCVHPLLPLEDWDAYGVLLGAVQQELVAQPRRHLTRCELDESRLLEVLVDGAGFAPTTASRLWSSLAQLRGRDPYVLPFTAELQEDERLVLTWSEEQATSLFGLTLAWSHGVGERPVAIDGANWLDLPPPDRLAYARMEQAIQDGNQLNGSALLRDLLPDIDADIGRQLKRLVHLGQILEASDWLVPVMEDDVLSARSEGQEIVVSWRAKTSRNASLEERIALWWEWRLAAKRWEEVHRELSFIKTDAEPMACAWQTLAPRYDHHCDRRILWHCDHKVTNSLYLFLEYVYRVDRDFPDALQDPSLIELFRVANADAIVASYFRFVDLLHLSDELRRAMLEHSYHATKAEAAAPAAIVSVVEGDTPPPVKEVATPTTPEVPDRQGEREEAKRISQALRARLRKAAAEELAKMNPTRYRALKRSYLESLDESARKMMLDVQERMQAGLFDDHLKAHLIGFMVDNPGRWSSSAPTISAGQNGRG